MIGLIYRNWYDHIWDQQPPPVRPPAPTDVPSWLAPDGHALDVVQVSTGVSMGWCLPPSLELDDPRVWTVEHAPARDGYRGRCQCGHDVIVSRADWNSDIPPAASVIVAAWLRHLVAVDAVDGDSAVSLRRDLEDAESIARYGHKYHPTRNEETAS